MAHTEQEKTVTEVLACFSRNKGNLIPALQRVQQNWGYLPREALLSIAEYFDIPPVDVYGVATFYNQFRFNPPGKHSVRVCLGTACHMKGGYITLDAWKRRLKIEPGQTTPDREFDMDTVACVGCCTMAPVSVVDNQPQAQVEPTKVDGILLSLGYDTQKTKDSPKK
ncbi:MAG TPA: NAD(P)H-dependent oxidoreductase subunit E [Dehalococcoidales bacterium]|nr:NAD(P)H-dependent oxidoreductase subunit E [Dehalococcoidales bacterium]